MPDIWFDVDTELPKVPVNILPLIDDTDFKTQETTVSSTNAGLALRWNFVTTTGGMTQTTVTASTGPDYLWTNVGGGLYAVEMPASTGASANNNTEGFGWYTGAATGILPWRGPVLGFRASGINDKLVDSAYSATRGLAGTALPDAAADGAGGLPISDAGGLDMDAMSSAVWSVSTRTLTSYGGGSTFVAADVWSVAARTLTSGSAVASDVWGTAVDGTLTYGQSMKLMTAVNFSNSTGGGSTSITFRNWGSTKDRVSYTVTTVGNRTVTTYDLT